MKQMEPEEVESGGEEQKEQEEEEDEKILMLSAEERAKLDQFGYNAGGKRKRPFVPAPLEWSDEPEADTPLSK